MQPTKKVYVILAFHAHEPLWDVPKKILEEIGDPEMRNSIGTDNWIKKRAESGRDIYKDLISFANNLGVTVCLEATNELLYQIAEVMPDTFQALGNAFRAGQIYPVYGHAHHSHVALLDDEEIAEEIRLNQQFVHVILKAPQPRYKGIFPTEDSLDARKLRGIKQCGVDYVIFPHLTPTKTRFEVEGTTDANYHPFTIGNGIIALPRNFSISQGIWRPVTRMRPDGLKNQGFILGRYWVFDEEYRAQNFVRFPITRDQGIADYQNILEQAIAASPQHGLLLYIQDLELMDFGDVALDILQEAWKKVRQNDRINISFVTPDEYLDENPDLRPDRLGRVRFHQISWAPEIRVLLRYDGHYPPLDAGPFRGIDVSEEIFKRWPFIFWEPGRYLGEVFGSLLASFEFSPLIQQEASRLQQIEYRPSRLDLPSRIALHFRLMRRACNWGWQPNEGLQKRPFLHAYRILMLLQDELAGPRGDAVVARFAPLRDNLFVGLERILEVILDTRRDYLAYGIGKLEKREGMDHGDALQELATFELFRRGASYHVEQARMHNDRLRAALQPRDQVEGILGELCQYSRDVFLAIDHIQKAWSKVSDTESLIVAMYDYLYGLFPPKFPAILESTLTEDERRAVGQPELA